MEKLKGEFKKVKLEGSMRVSNRTGGFFFYLILNWKEKTAKLAVLFKSRDSIELDLEMPDTIRLEDWPELDFGVERAIDSLNRNKEIDINESFLDEIFKLEMRKKNNRVIVMVKWTKTEELAGVKYIHPRKIKGLLKFNKEPRPVG